MIPFTTTTVSIGRPPVGEDPTDEPVIDPVSAMVPANIVSPSGSDLTASREQVDAVLIINPTPQLRFGDIVVEESTADRYRVTWITDRHGFGLDHQKAGLQAISGASRA